MGQDILNNTKDILPEQAEDLRAITERVLELRPDDWTDERFAQRLGVTGQAVGNWRRFKSNLGGNAVSLAAVLAASQKFGESLVYLLTGLRDAPEADRRISQAREQAIELLKTLDSVPTQAEVERVANTLQHERQLQELRDPKQKKRPGTGR